MGVYVPLNPFIQSPFFTLTATTATVMVPAHLLNVEARSHPRPEINACASGYGGEFAPTVHHSLLARRLEPFDGTQMRTGYVPIDDSPILPSDVVIEELPQGYAKTKTDISAEALSEGLRDELQSLSAGEIITRIEEDLSAFEHDAGKLLYLRKAYDALKLENMLHIDLIHFLAVKTLSIIERHAPGMRRLLVNGRDFYNFFVYLYRSALEAERNLENVSGLPSGTPEKVADIIYIFAKKGAVFYAYGKSKKNSRFEAVTCVINAAQRYAHLGLREKAAEARATLVEMGEIFELGQHPYDWAMGIILNGENSFKEEEKLQVGLPFELGIFEAVAKKGGKMEAEFKEKVLSLREIGITKGYISANESEIPGIGVRDPFTKAIIPY